MARRQPRTRPLVGWREWVVLPELSPIAMKAKIDTGARTSTLHAYRLTVASRDDGDWATFELHPIQRSKVGRSKVVYPVTGFKSVRSSTGHTEHRPVIRTAMRIGSRTYQIDMTLTSRDDMGFRMLLGRSAIRRRFWVDPGRSFLQALPAADDPKKRSS